MILRYIIVGGLSAGIAACGPVPSKTEPAPLNVAEQEAGPAPKQTPQSSSSQSLDGVDNRNGFTSDYTTFVKEDCTVLTQRREEGLSATYRCVGFKNIPVLVQESDLRMDLDAGAENERFETTGPYNSIMDTIEWRMQDGPPFAVIFRYKVHSEVGPQRTTLAVEKIGTAAVPGCRVGHVSGSATGANAQARQLADGVAREFVCGKDKPQIIGDTTLQSLGR